MRGPAGWLEPPPENRMHDEEFGVVSMRIRSHECITPSIYTIYSFKEKTLKCSCTERAIIDDKGLLHFSKCNKKESIKRYEMLCIIPYIDTSNTTSPASGPARAGTDLGPTNTKIHNIRRYFNNVSCIDYCVIKYKKNHIH